MHHAYLYSDPAALPALDVTDSADLVHEVYDKLPIDAVRELIRVAHLRPVGAAGTRVIVVETISITTEAQNALLKLLEEPPAHTVVHMLVRDQSQLLATLRSRFAKVDDQATVSLDEATVFLRASHYERLTLIADKTKAKDALWHRDLLTGLESVLVQQPDATAARTAVMFTRSRISGPGASVKMLLEHLALSLPVLK